MIGLRTLLILAEAGFQICGVLLTAMSMGTEDFTCTSDTPCRRGHLEHLDTGPFRPVTGCIYDRATFRALALLAFSAAFFVLAFDEALLVDGNMCLLRNIERNTLGDAMFRRRFCKQRDRHVPVSFIICVFFLDYIDLLQLIALGVSRRISQL